jgi:superfamily II DNA or RNA helicase
MTSKTTLILLDQVNCKFVGLDPIVRKRFNEALKFMVPHARHTPQFKLKRWDGKVSFGGLSGSTFINLLELVLPLIMEAGYEIEIDDRRPDYDFDFPVITEDFLAEKVWPEGHVMAGLPIMLRDYQVEAINTFFQNQQSIMSMSTGSGKTVLCACISAVVEQYGRSIVIVPSKTLVRQTEEDYKNIGLDVGVFYGDRKEWNHQHTICTWQSLSVFNKKTKKEEAEIPIDDFLDNVICVITDEVHSVKGNQLRDLLCGPMSTVPLRWGLTGTIPKEEYEFMSLLSSIGPVVGEIRASDLQDKGVLASCNVDIVQLQDNHVAFNDWDSEHKFLVSDSERLEWIGEYCLNLAATGNTLILVERRETGFALEKFIPNSIFIYGDTKADAREAEFKDIRTSEGKIIIATYGIAAVGINLPRIFNLVLFECGKSFIRVIQSIGRGLRKANDKSHVNITDFTSNLKFSSRHASKRRGFYNDAGYKHKTIKARYKK